MTVIQRTRKRLRLCCLLLALILIFIWGNSLLPGEVSAAFSQWVKDLLSKLFFGDGPGAPGHGLLRKFAHFSEFALLGACLGWLWAMLRKKIPEIPLLALGCGFLAACVDETVQRFSPGRNSSFTDVLIDTAGVTLGVALLTLGIIVHKKQKMKITHGGKQT